MYIYIYISSIKKVLLSDQTGQNSQVSPTPLRSSSGTWRSGHSPQESQATLSLGMDNPWMIHVVCPGIPNSTTLLFHVQYFARSCHVCNYITCPHDMSHFESCHSHVRRPFTDLSLSLADSVAPQSSDWCKLPWISLNHLRTLNKIEQV